MIMAPASDVADDKALAILAQVELHSLKATPGTIAPFEASAISWNVSGPEGFGLLLDNTKVPKVGEKLVTPLSTRTFSLKARAGTITQVLGKVTVTVDPSACRIVPVPNHVVEQFVRESIEGFLAERPATTRRGPDVVTVDAAGIDIRLALRQAVPKFPNPDVDIAARWQYRAFNGQLVEHFLKLDVSIRFPWWVWLLPFAYPGLPIAISMAKDSARADIRQRAAGGADNLELAVPPGLRILSAQFVPTNFEMLACPDDSLRRLLSPGAPALHVVSRPTIS
jgi:hypothetical protein